MDRRALWDKLLHDASAHYGDTFRRSLSDLDRQDALWTHEEVRQQLSQLADDIWDSWDAMTSSQRERLR